ncbi:hypothetical protein GCM10023187_08430 [Nibrella viscosa]|uniref:Uncharacterized protein n=1 Tax=Nibrella viscosa TaxID=1084524 RepID=A0ABP8JZ31_9BACT
MNDYSSSEEGGEYRPSGSEGEPSMQAFTTLAEALLYLSKKRQQDDALYCIIAKNEAFYVAPFSLGRLLIDNGFQLVYGG